MTFVEVYFNDDLALLERLMRDGFCALYAQTLPTIRFGRVILWQGRMFQQIEFADTAKAFEIEDQLFRLWSLPVTRARLQLGSLRGAVFTTPPEAGSEVCARIKEGGRCGRDYEATPFHYLDCEKLS